MSNGEDVTKKIEEELTKFEEEEKKKKKKPEEIKERLKIKESELIQENEWFITKKTFKRFIYKYSLPFQYEKDVIENFFNEHPENIKMQEYEELIK